MKFSGIYESDAASVSPLTEKQVLHLHCPPQRKKHICVGLTHELYNLHGRRFQSGVQSKTKKGFEKGMQTEIQVFLPLGS